ncbi:hypothetical protein FTV88_2450 [Heliorestis convoluta]|uniref:Uncharacterized protein n=1 Tax=Heliorestis convoluta TaxID=356322 RepID=A0A5Q2N4L6_9FIRM|nr:hypothetical protein FTV88_2450 [Heliorestis convoluta]
MLQKAQEQAAARITKKEFHYYNRIVITEKFYQKHRRIIKGGPKFFSEIKI